MIDRERRNSAARRPRPPATFLGGSIRTVTRPAGIYTPKLNAFIGFVFSDIANYDVVFTVYRHTIGLQYLHLISAVASDRIRRSPSHEHENEEADPLLRRQGERSADDLEICFD